MPICGRHVMPEGTATWSGIGQPTARYNGGRSRRDSCTSQTSQCSTTRGTVPSMPASSPRRRGSLPWLTGAGQPVSSQRRPSVSTPKSSLHSAGSGRLQRRRLSVDFSLKDMFKAPEAMPPPVVEDQLGEAELAPKAGSDERGPHIGARRPARGGGKGSGPAWRPWPCMTLVGRPLPVASARSVPCAGVQPGGHGRRRPDHRARPDLGVHAAAARRLGGHRLRDARKPSPGQRRAAARRAARARRAGRWLGGCRRASVPLRDVSTRLALGTCTAAPRRFRKPRQATRAAMRAGR